MVDELKKALDKAKQLPDNQQKSLAELILNEIEWERSFSLCPISSNRLQKKHYWNTRINEQDRWIFNAIPNHVEVLEKL